jgi:hypothetical protein
MPPPLLAPQSQPNNKQHPINKGRIKEADRFDKLVFNLSNIEKPRKGEEKLRGGQDGQVFSKKMSPL